ncbi:uncharacterized protein LOC6726005 [Drosophila simulans]|uniref:GD17202 n=1 Tax=Drosophila simulans TaxID=7240 RepID=B4R559_DROSI|nr:uncharacterized protein LOC6726005 [Drosophila simulans]EDX17960.1 GD17202 [Drosophila simulans]KMZ09831.1 uncharacterized protein Dsimw501_GD17202 [Drosophila simulans]
MSLFPAYGGGRTPAASSAKKTTKPGEEEPATGANWKKNESYIKKHVDIATKEPESDSSSSSDHSEEEADKRKEDEVTKTKKLPPGKPLEFDATDGFYVDKLGNSSYRHITTLKKPARPRYKSRMKRLSDREYNSHGFSRAHSKFSRKRSRYVREKLVDEPGEDEVSRLQEQLTRTKVLVQQDPEVLDHWLQLHRLLNLNLDKANRLAVAEQQIYNLETALEHHPSNQQILRLYTHVANATYQASEVARRFEKMLKRNPFQYTLWSNLIMVTQGDMACCNVSAVLRIYEYSMRRMHVGHNDEITRRFIMKETDEIMLKLFHNCLLFLRQSGHTNWMFALIRLSMELNFPYLTFECLGARAAREQPLIGFEEVVLRSGMPMPEIWARVEQLRQSYCFLPLKDRRASSTDVFKDKMNDERYFGSDKLVPYVHALKSLNNRLHLVLVVVQLMKLPLIRSACLADKLNPCIEDFGESEAIEMLFAAMVDRHSYAVASLQYEFDAAMINLAREMSVTPSYMPHLVGHKLYAATVSKMLLKCAEIFNGDEPKRRLLLILYLRFQKLLIILHKSMGKLTKKYFKNKRTRIRKLINLTDNRNVVGFYTEQALCEIEAKNYRMAFSIMGRIVTKKSEESSHISCVDTMHLYLVCAELHIHKGRQAEAIGILVSLCLGKHVPINQKTVHSKKQVLEGLRNAEVMVRAELNALDTQPAEMTLEEYFLPNKLLILLRAICLIEVLNNRRRKEARKWLNDLQNDQFGPEAVKDSERKRFIREQIMEIQMLHLRLSFLVFGQVEFYTGFKMIKLDELLEKGLEEFPRNMVFLQMWSSLKTIMWYRQRSRLIRTKAGVASLVHLVVAVHHRFGIVDDNDKFSKEATRMAVCNRLISMIETFLPTNVDRLEVEEEHYRILRRNSIYWRLYMMCLSKTNASFKRSKDVLVMAMDECPWDKSLLMEGARVLPVELASLQDLMTEKEIRVFAMPEEVDVLRGL